MTFAGSFAIGLFGMMLIYGFEGIVGTRITALVMFSFVGIAVFSWVFTPRTPSYPLVETITLVGGGVVGIPFGMMFKDMLEADDGTPLVFDLYRRART